MFELKNINTSIVSKGKSIKVTIYHLNREIGKIKFNELIKGYSTKSLHKASHSYKAIILIDGYNVIIETKQANDSSRGHRTNYAYVDSKLFDSDRGLEIYKKVIHSSILNDNVDNKSRHIEEKRIYTY